MVLRGRAGVSGWSGAHALRTQLRRRPGDKGAAAAPAALYIYPPRPPAPAAPRATHRAARTAHAHLRAGVGTRAAAGAGRRLGACARARRGGGAAARGVRLRPLGVTGGGVSVGAARRQSARAGGSAHVRRWGRAGAWKGACAPSGPTAGMGRGVSGELASSARPTRPLAGGRPRAWGRKGVGLALPLRACARMERGEAAEESLVVVPLP